MRPILLCSAAMASVLGLGSYEFVHSRASAAPDKAGTSTAALLSAAAMAQAADPASIPSNPDRDVFFGQTHVHTSWSLDAYTIGNILTGPAEAYEYAMGMPIKHPMGYEVKIGRPLDFQGVTDHSEYLGMLRAANDPNSPVSKLPIADKLRVKSPEDALSIFKYLVSFIANNKPIPGFDNPELQRSIWQQMVAIADKYYQPGKFTTFASYEWTSAPGYQNMHRNVFFRDSKKVPEVPFTSMDSDKAEDLWAWLDTQRKAGNDALAISHNGNLSNGLMFPVSTDGKGKPLTAAWAQERLTNEPLTEIHQLKGTSETTPELSPTDEFADYELMNFLIGVDNSYSNPHGSFVREAYENGLLMQSQRGYNPYKFGIVGAGDSHNTVTAYTQSNYFGGHSFLDGTPKARLSGKVEAGMDIVKLSTSGLAGVWAEKNTRESIFDAMRRKEVYGTSGVRIKVRLFGGWNYPQNIFAQKDWVKAGYRDGVPMGGDLGPKNGAAPSFVVWAVKDPDDGNLDRIQIVKGWSDGTRLFEHVYDVAWAGDRKPDPKTGKVPAIKSTVNIADASYTNSVGAVELKKVWRDPQFNPNQHAFYYVRVLQIPTPRWSTYDAKTLGVAPPKGVSPTVQERAWTSPIWYTPLVTQAPGQRGAMRAAPMAQTGRQSSRKPSRANGLTFAAGS